MFSASSARVRRLVQCALFAALAAVCSQIALPMPWGVPVNLALFAVCLAGSLLGPVWGAAAVAAYLALAAAGVPVLAGFQGGLAALLGRTGGYAVGYLPAALLVGALTRPSRRRFGALCAAMAAGCAACYALGTVWFLLLTHTPLWTALGLCVLPYLPGDAVKIALAAALTVQLDRRLPRGLL